MRLLVGAAPVAPAPAPVTPTSGTDAALADALRRFIVTSKCPTYLRDAARPWLGTR